MLTENEQRMSWQAGLLMRCCKPDASELVGEELFYVLAPPLAMAYGRSVYLECIEVTHDNGQPGWRVDVDCIDPSDGYLFAQPI